MYDNEIYSGSGAGSNTSGVYSGGNAAERNENQNQAENQNVNVYQTQSTGQGTNENVYQAGNAGTGQSTNTSPYQHTTGTAYQGINENVYQNTADAGKKHSRKERHHKKDGNAGKSVRKVMMSVSMGLLFGLFAGLGFYAVQQGANQFELENSPEPVNGSSVQNMETMPEGMSESGIEMANTNNVTVVDSDVSDVVEEVMPAMVSIVNSYTQTGTNIFGQTFTQPGESGGSGIIVGESEEELLLVTNYHVVEGADELTVTFIDSSEAKASIKGTDSDMDLAVIAIPLDDLTEETKNNITIATLGNSDTLKLGEPVIAIGNALGYGQSVTTGIVSALNREIMVEDGSTNAFIQTDAAINHGNSGGALLNVKGEVVGINSNKLSGNSVEGMGYAIPISAANPIISDLMVRQTRNKVEEGEMGYLGINLQEVTEQVSAMFNMPQGVYVISTIEGSGAEKAGIMSGDIITKFDGQSIDSYADLQQVLQYYAAGDNARITIMRPENGQYVQYDLDITLGERPEEAQ